MTTTWNPETNRRAQVARRVQTRHTERPEAHMLTRAHVDFAGWMRAVDRALSGRCGLVSADLPDINYRDLYDAGEPVCNAAQEALDYAHDDDEYDEYPY